MIYIIIILFIFNLFITYLFLKEKEKLNKEKEKNSQQYTDFKRWYYAEWLRTQEDKAKAEIEEWKNVEKCKAINELQAEENLIQTKIKALNWQIDEKKDQLELLKENQSQILQEHKQRIEVEIDLELDRRKAYEFDKIASEIEAFINQAAVQKSIAQKEIEEIKSQLEEYKQKRNALNEQIRIENEAENEFDMHRIVLSNAAIQDIHFLKSIEEKINNQELLHKLIWTEYIQKPFNQMLKNMFGSNVPKNVIYCIENHNNKKKYIGKTSGLVSNRWTEHIKTSLSIGSIKKNLIHSALDGHWDEFAFSIVEIVDENQKLSEREKYYISFFESDKYGYNEKIG